MNHDDALTDPMLDLPSQPAKLAAIESVTDIELALEEAKSPLGALAPTQTYSQPPSKQTLPASPVVDNFLPSPSRLLILGGLGLAGVLGVGAIASTFITHSTTVKVQALVEPAVESQPIQFAMGGVVETLSVQELEPVESGQEIASFRNPSLQSNFHQVERRIAGISEEISQTNGQLAALARRRSAESTWLQQLTTEGVDTQSNQTLFDNSRKQLLEHLSKLAAQLEKEQQQLNQVQQQIDSLTILAPKDGTIYNLQLSQLGQTVGPNETIAQIIPNEVELEIKALVPGTAIDNVEVGYPTRIRLSDCPAFRFGSLQGQVSSVEPVQPTSENNLGATNTPSEQLYSVTIDNNEQSLQSGSRTCELLPGMQGEVTIIAKQEKLFSFLLRKLRLNANS